MMEHLTDQIVCFFCGLLGVLMHLLIKYETLAKEAYLKGVNLGLRQFARNEWRAICLAIIPVIVWLFTFAEATRYYPTLQDYVRTTFVMMGLSGSYLFQRLSGRSRRWIREKLDSEKGIDSLNDKAKKD